MKIILLCAGYATRLYPLTKNQPKALLPVGGRPILDWILDRVRELDDVEGVLTVTNHRFAPHFKKWAAKKKEPWPVEVVDDRTTSNETRLGAIGDLALVIRKRIASPLPSPPPSSLRGRARVGEDLLVIAGDNLFDFDLRKFLKFAESRRPHPVLAIYDVKSRELASKYGLVRLDRKNRVEAFYEKPQDPPTTLASCGIYWLPAESLVLLDRYLAGGHNSDQPGHYMRWLAETDQLFALPLEGQWWDIGDLDSYRIADAHYKRKKEKI